MADEKSDNPYDLIEERTLWSLQVRHEDGNPWVDYGAHREEWEEVLRVYNYRKEHFPEEETRMLVTEVKVRVADPDWLTLKMKEEKTAQGGSPAVSSE